MHPRARNPAGRRFTRALPLLLAVAIGGGATYAAWSIRDARRAEVELAAQVSADHVAHHLETFLNDRLATLHLLARSWQPAPPSESAFRALSRDIQAQWQGFQALSWVDPAGTIRWVVPLSGNERAFGLDLSDHPAAGPLLAAARADGQIRATPPIDLAQGGRGFAVYLPLGGPGAPRGYLNGVFRNRELLAACFGDVHLPGYVVEVLDGEAEVGVVGEGGKLAHHYRDGLAEVPIGGRAWTLRVCPTAGRTAVVSGGDLQALLLVGWIVALLVGWEARRAVRRSEAAHDALAARVELTERVEAQNAELETLVHLTAHDLRTPVVTLSGFGRAIAEDVEALRSALDGDTPDLETAHTLIDEDLAPGAAAVQRAAIRLDGSLQGIQRMARAAREQMRADVVDMDTVVRDARALLAGMVERLDGAVEIAALPPCRGDGSALRHVFQNLIENALKYRHPERAPAIEIRGAPEVPGTVLYTVADNGIGIDPAFREQVFDAFRRLEPNHAGGQGLGLALVRRMLERQGGRIRMCDNDGRGTRVEIRMPAPDATRPPEKTARDA